jgi:hypothetical protein
MSDTTEPSVPWFATEHGRQHNRALISEEAESATERGRALIAEYAEVYGLTDDEAVFDLIGDVVYAAKVDGVVMRDSTPGSEAEGTPDPTCGGVWRPFELDMWPAISDRILAICVDMAIPVERPA